MNITLKLSGLYSSLFVIRFSLTFEKKFGGGGGGQKRAFLSIPHGREHGLDLCAVWLLK